MKLIYFLTVFQIVLLLGCKKLPGKSTFESEPSNLESSPERSAEEFNLENARVYDKFGKVDELKTFILNLNEIGLLKEAQKKDLLEKTDNHTLTSNFDVFDKAGRTLKIDLKNDSTSKIDDFPQYYDSLYHKAAHLAGLNISYLNMEEIFDEYEGLPLHYANVSFVFEGNTYTHRVENDPGLGKLDEGFYRVINDVLSDQKNAHRLYLAKKLMVVETVDGNTYLTTSKEAYALIFLTYFEAHMLLDNIDIVSMSIEDHRSPLSKDRKKEVLNQLEEKGFMKGYTPENIRTMYEKISQSRIYNLEDILFHAGLRICIDPIMQENEERPFEGILNSLKAYSKNAFSPEQIEESTDRYGTQLSYTLKGKKYQVELDNLGGRLDIATFMKKVNKDMTLAKLDGNFYLMNTPGRSLCYIFLTGEQAEVLNKIGTDLD